MGGDYKFTRSRGVWGVSLVLVGLAMLLTLGLVACTDLTESGSGSTATTVEPVSTDVPTTSPSTTAVPTTSPAVVNVVSQESLDYAEWLGGTSHKGEKLYLVIGASVKSETQAKALLEPAKAVGDMQSSFIVQLSDNFAGMTPGYWVVFEAYDGYPSEEDLMFCRRPFPDAYVKTATVLTDDPIPVRPGG
jgi:hypothetical protein